MSKTVLLFSGEGTHNEETRFKLLKQSPVWTEAAAILDSKLNIDLERLWDREIGSHRCPYSPLLTVVSQVSLADLWRRWGYAPDVVIGHSTGELSAAYAAGLYSIEEILVLAYRIGEVAANLKGEMMHGSLTDAELERLPLPVSSLNFATEGGRHVTVCGHADEMADLRQRHPHFVRMKLPHPWHHPDYARFSDQLEHSPSARIEPGLFLSGLTTHFETRLTDTHWHDWLVSPIDFIGTLETLDAQHGSEHLDFIEIGFHPVLGKCLEVFEDYTHVSSMFRGEEEVQWILHQRRQMDRQPFKSALAAVIDAYRPGLSTHEPLAYQGFDSL